MSYNITEHFIFVVTNELKNMIEDNLEVIDSIDLGQGTVVEVLQFKNLAGSADLRVANNLYFAEQSGMRLKMVRISLVNSHARIEPGALYYMKGDLEMKASSGGGMLKGLSRKMLSGETFFVNEIHGTGEIYLEPTFGHFFLNRINPEDDAIIVDKGIFYGGTAGLDVGSHMQRNLSSALWGGEGFFQTKIQGDGIAILYSPVPVTELQKFFLNGEKLSVDGNFTLLRSESINFKAEKSSKSWIATSVSGEGLLQTFSGTGHIWIAPTQGIYEQLSTPQGLANMSLPPGSSHTQTETTTKKRK
jgi:uncharacterized protein (AIM24 family)